VRSDPHRSSRLPTALALLCTLFAVGLVVRDVAEDRDPDPAGGRAPAGPQAVSPPAPTTVASARGRRMAAQPDPAPTDGQRSTVAGDPPAASPGEPIIKVRRGEEVELRDAPRGEVVARVDDETDFGSPTAFSVNGRRDGWFAVPTPDLPNGRLGWVRADPEVLRGHFTDYRIVVDLSGHAARLLEGERVVRRWTVTVGAPDSPTPTGRFSVTDLFEGGLHPAYGCCAVALSATQPDLPSDWVGGDRIAFHGTSGPLGVDASNGCIRSADRDVRALIRTVPLGTPVRIRR